MKKHDFFERQNNEYMLNILYAQRYFYNKANLLEGINIIIILVICLFNFFEIDVPVIKIIVNVFLVLINYIITKYIKSNITKGAKLKKYFDYMLYNFDGITEHLKKECKEFGCDVLNKKRKDYNQQISSDGKATPPGLRNWYFDEKRKSTIDIIKSMQNQNLYWDKKISIIYITFIIAFFILLFSLYLVVCILMEFNIIELLAGFIPFTNMIVFIVDKIKSYLLIDKEVTVAKRLLDKAKSIDDLMEVQEIIDNRRQQDFCPPNIIHKIIANKIHIKLEFINAKE